MSFKSLLALQTIGQDPQAIKPILHKAKDMDAFLTVLLMVEVAPPPVSSYGVISESHWNEYQSQLQEMTTAERIKIEAQMRHIGVDGAVEELILNRGELERHIIAHGTCSDMAIVANGTMFSGKLAAKAFDDILFSTGLPILILGQEKSPFPAVKRALIAWDGGVEAAKAIRAAMPVLETCDQVSIACVDAEQTRLGPAPGDALATHLARHDITITVHNLASNGRAIEDVLQQHAKDIDAEIIIMGGYAHSRIREWLIGGTTRSILQNCALPVIMAH